MAQATSILPLTHPTRPAPPQASTAKKKLPPDAGDPLLPEEPRKLVRPRLPEHLAHAAGAPRRLRGERPLFLQEHAAAARPASTATAGTAEGFFLQKQMQTQTPLVFVMEDNEQVHGVIEWYDRDTIKVRNTTRVLIYKRAIKYLYKASELHPL